MKPARKQTRTKKKAAPTRNTEERIDDALKALGEVRADLARMRAALKPFASIYRGRESWPLDGGCARFFPMRDIKAAYDALAAPVSSVDGNK